MNSAEVPVLRNSFQKRAYGDITPGIRIAQLERDNVCKIFRPEIEAAYRPTLLHECNVPPQDIGPLLLDPGIDIRDRGRYAGTEDTAAQATQFTGLFFGGEIVHGYSYLFAGNREKEGGKIFLSSIMEQSPFAGAVQSAQGEHC